RARFLADGFRADDSWRSRSTSRSPANHASLAPKSTGAGARTMRRSLSFGSLDRRADLNPRVDQPVHLAPLHARQGSSRSRLPFTSPLLPATIVGHHPGANMPSIIIPRRGITKEQALDVCMRAFSGKYEVYASQLLMVDFVIKKSDWTGISVRVRDHDQGT